ncbi:Hpt domain-containing protein [Sphingomonas ginkgonis]|uniref:Hpt domain-containing protein n=1 Tax=Sphingomonas ginkgonis TaxID=2315330 RepID=A0A3R9X7N6_9SPHN|nr:Hpt domain-containing protein [Sphingomonas ginkgonis]RST30690.1 Hpt domain-containing protein [Sphingomonas ginkgonis]
MTFDDFRRRYREKCAGELEPLRAALADGDEQRLRDIGHRFAGNGGTFGYPVLSDLGAALEQAVEERADQAAIAAAARALMSELEATARHS